MKIYVTQEIFNKERGDNSYYGIFAVESLPTGNKRYFRRDSIGSWEMINRHNAVEYFKRCNPIKMEEVLNSKNEPLKTFKRNAPRKIKDEIFGDKSYVDYETYIIAVLPNGTLISYSDFIKNHTENRCPIDIINPIYIEDGNYQLKEIEGETINQIDYLNALKAELSYNKKNNIHLTLPELG